MKEGQIMLTARGEKVKIVSLDKVPCTINWITVWSYNANSEVYCNPDGLKPLTQ
jgi:hypothetical protein